MTDEKDKKGFLTPADRKFLRGEKEYDSKHSRYERRKSIRERTRGAFRDFALLTEQLPKNEREKIFTTDSKEEYLDLEEDITNTIQFIYAAAGSEGRFRRLLKDGVIRGEAERLPPSSHVGFVSVRFEVEPTPAIDIEATAEHLKNGKVSKITGDAARGFLSAASGSNEFDSELIDRILEEREEMREIMEEHREQGRPWMDKNKTDED